MSNDVINFNADDMFHDSKEKRPSREDYAQERLPNETDSNILTKGGSEGTFYLTTHSIYFIYGYMASDIW